MFLCAFDYTALASFARDIINPADSFTAIRFTITPLFSPPPSLLGFFLSVSIYSGFIDMLAHSVRFVRWHSEISEFIFSRDSPQSKNEVLNLEDIEEILALFQGNMLYFVSVVVEKYLEL